MVGAPRKRVTYAEYKEIADDSDVKWEYIAGEIVAMSGGTIAHARIIGQLQDMLRAALRGRPCIVLPSDMRVRIQAVDRSTYPDVYVVCGEPELASDDAHAVVNPTVIIEVQSDSSSESDRTIKFDAYRRLTSVHEYVLVSQQQRRVEVYRRDGRRWHLDEYSTGERFALESLDIVLAVDDAYADNVGTIVA